MLTSTPLIHPNFGPAVGAGFTETFRSSTMVPFSAGPFSFSFPFSTSGINCSDSCSWKNNTQHETKNYCNVSIWFNVNFSSNVNSSSNFIAMIERGIVPKVFLQPQVVVITIESNIIVLEYQAHYPACVR